MQTWRFLVALALPALVGCSGSSDDDEPASGGAAGAGGAETGGADSGGGGSGAAGSGGTGAGGSSGGAGGSSGQGGSGGQGGDAGQGGAPGDPWAGCPSAQDYSADPGWTHELEVSDDAVYCAAFDENRTLKEELAAKALLRVAPGSYRLPGAASAGLGLPVCLKLGASAAPVAAQADAVRYESSTLETTTSHQYYFDQTVPDPDRRLTIGLRVAAPSADTPRFRLDGAAPSPFDETVPSASFWLCQGLEPCMFDRAFDSCSHAESTLNRHDVELDTGSISLELRIGESFASTEPGAFVRASGSFRGQAFDQRDYFKLIYRPAHHHFERFFAVLFDEPIDGACGVEIDALEPFDDLSPDQAFTVDCELNQLEPLTVIGHVLTQDP